MRGLPSILAFGLLVLAAYWVTLARGYVYYGGDHAPSPPGVRSSAPVGRARPSFWTTESSDSIQSLVSFASRSGSCRLKSPKSSNIANAV